jgi:hypothetical protein
MDLVIGNGLVVDVESERIVPADVVVSGDTIAAVVERGAAGAGLAPRRPGAHDHRSGPGGVRPRRTCRCPAGV